VRFDPNYIPGEDAPLLDGGEIDLPDDLLELAAQLRDDAAYLAERYPADLSARSASEGRLVASESSPELETVRQTSADPRSRIGLKVVTAIGSMAAALAITVAVSPMFWHDAAANNNSVAVSPPAAAAPATSDIIIHEPTTPGGPRIGQLPWAPTPAIGEVTGPELEGLLDLWQNDEQPAETRISI
jgi:hypothetical protein